MKNICFQPKKLFLILIGLIMQPAITNAEDDVQKWPGYFQCLYTFTELEYKFKQTESQIGLGETILDEKGKPTAAVILTTVGGNKKYIATPNRFIDFEKSNQGMHSNQIQLKKDENGKYQTCHTERGEDSLDSKQVENVILLMRKYIDDLDNDPDKKNYMITKLKVDPENRANLKKCISFLPKGVMWSKLNALAAQANQPTVEDLKLNPARR